jgi:hypothetical protein
MVTSAKATTRTRDVEYMIAAVIKAGVTEEPTFQYRKTSFEISK